ncbi:MAG: prepilin peptidase [Gammaproteobacteria bacterium]|nr:prepilin peptidase [Gammaproteobacteria bacterium]
MIHLLTITIVLVWSFTCAAQDIKYKKISNFLTIGMFIAATLYILISGNTLLNASFQNAIFAFMLAIALSLPGYITGRMGAGDVKMLCALAVATYSDYVLISVIGAALALVIWSTCQPLWSKLPQVVHKAFPFMDPTTGSPLPYAPFLFLGMLCATLIHSAVL